MKLWILLVKVFSSLTLLQCSEGKNILFFWGLSGISHRISVWPLVEQLLESGHNITFFSPFPPKKPDSRVHEIVPENFIRDLGIPVDLLKLRLNEGPDGITKIWTVYFDFAINGCKSIMRNPVLLDWINSSSYDLVFINGLFNDCGLGIANKFKAPHIIYGPIASFWWWGESYGFPQENLPEFQYHFDEPMNFLQRAWNYLRPLYWYYYRLNYMFPPIEAALKEGLNMTDMPSLADIEKNASLIFVYSSHFAGDFARTLPPNIIQVDGMHILEKNSPLPKDLDDFINAGTNGFIFFSFGTFARPENLPEKHRRMIFESMKSFREIQFLVKWDGEAPVNITENIKAIKWGSQQDILASPKILGFISHGGLLGSQEATAYGVPMIVLPIFADQDYNCDRVCSSGRGIKLEISTLTQKKLEDAIKEITSNKTYKENAKRASEIFKDRKSKPLDLAVYWTNYVLNRRGDTAHLRPVGSKLNWYQRRHLDIWTFLLVLVGITIICIIFCVLYFASCILTIITTHNLSEKNKLQLKKNK